jgi:hypothetical protein
LPWFSSLAKLVRVPGLSLPYQLKISLTRGVFIYVIFNVQAVSIFHPPAHFNKGGFFPAMPRLAGPQPVSRTPPRIQQASLSASKTLALGAIRSVGHATWRRRPRLRVVAASRRQNGHRAGRPLNPQPRRPRHRIWPDTFNRTLSPFPDSGRESVFEHSLVAKRLGVLAANHWPT